MHSTKIRLKKLNNLRDLGGIVTEDGHTVRSGKLYRSGQLSKLPKKTMAAIRAAGVTTIVDLRIPAEHTDHPDTIIDGIRYVRLPVLCTPAEVVECEKTMRLTMQKESYRLKTEIADMDEYMIQTYRSILFQAEPQEMLAKFLRIVIENEGSILWHCASGKDRAGICSMLVEALLGVGERTLLEDYAVSARFLRKKYMLNRIGLFIAPVSVRFKKFLFGYMKVKKSYLKAVIDEMNENYGSITSFCQSVLGVTDGDIAVLKSKYLV